MRLILKGLCRSVIKTLIERQKQFIEESEQLLADYEVGHRSRREERDGRVVDVTDEWIADIREKMGEPKPFSLAS
jgi:hypothetical protein